MTMDPTGDVRRRIRLGGATVAEVHAVLAEVGWEALTADTRADYCTFLIDRAGSDRADAAEAWSTLDAFWTDYVRDRIARRAHALLLGRSIGGLRRLTTVVAGRPGALPALVQSLTETMTAAPQPAQLDTYVELLATMPASVAVDPAVHARFLARPAAGGLLVERLAGQLDGVLEIWRPLVTDDTRWVRPLILAATGDATAANGRDLKVLRAAWTDGPLVALGLAADRGHLPVLLRLDWAELADVAGALADRSALRGHLERARTALRSDPPQWTDLARYDALCLIADGEPVGLDRTGLPDEYLDELATCWRTPAAQRVHDTLVTRLITALEPRAAGTRGPGGTDDLLRIVDKVEPSLRSWAADRLGAHEPLDHLAHLARRGAEAVPMLHAVTPLLPHVPDEHLLDVVRPWLVPGREGPVQVLVVALKTAGSDRSREFAAALLRLACDSVRCPEFAPRFHEFVAWIAPHAAEMARQVADEHRPLDVR